MTGLKIRSVVVAPVVSQGRLLGAIVVDTRVQEKVFSPKDAFSLDLLAPPAALALERWEDHRLREGSDPPGKGKEDELFGHIVGRAPATLALKKLLGRACSSDATALILGETGTGKELVARTLHEEGKRRGKRFVAINLATVDGALAESTLFGHVQGAFTGANSDQAGLFEEADGGTLFLDEVAETSLAVQVKLLRVLETRSVRRLGGAGEKRVDVRVIAATNRDLAALVAKESSARSSCIGSTSSGSSFLLFASGRATSRSSPGTSSRGSPLTRRRSPAA
ncbi:sigma-54 factor interaction domain-containing protein [bacterium]|nr:sigma-54 factor interaction domain-containing protein [bacterium]